ncbi:hypothetical protein DCAR_0415582 [Daucus carota subsp. sativus]|uniref:Integrase catalytic domain-containing protein n=1 Tax=Daucus carota subsp. sativus TaxID=79200 RepID=A0AAF0WX09_DAUCS|nr:hypothetical protein DCAR_0415582 [Daucus carota subsp. sativus]
MPFGLMNAPATFQSLMNDVFRPYLRRFVLVFFDDILVYSKSESEHIHHLQLVLELLHKHQLYANLKKCDFGRTTISYLGHMISGAGVAVDMEKVQSMLDWPQPRNLRELRGFLGLTGYYRRFIANYAHIAQPLTQQLKKDSFGWSEDATNSFQNLKAALINPPVLALPDFEKEFVIEADASGFGLGAVLMQAGRPLAYYSKLLGVQARQKSIYEKELMAICLAIQKWRHYLAGRHFIVCTDQQSLKHIMLQREVNVEYQKWVRKLMGFDFEVRYKPGLTNKAADALSRKQAGIGLNALVSRAAIDWTELDKELAADKVIQKLVTTVSQSTGNVNGFYLKEGRLWFKERCVISQSSSFIPSLLYEYHDSAVGGHGGELRTYLRLAGDWYWVGMRRDVAKYVQKCLICQQQKASQQVPAGLLQPLPIPSQIWDDISMDFIDGLPLSKGFNSIFVVVDRLSKYAHFIGLKHPYTAPTVAEVFVREIVRLHGFPVSIVSDRDRIFLSLFWKELFRLQGTALKHSTAYHPQTDGQTEIVNKGLESYLRCFIGGKPKSWAQWLSWAEFSYNTAPHSSTKFSPFKIVYGRDPPQLLHFGRGQTPVHSLDEMLLERDAILADLQFHLLQSQQRMKAAADTHRRDEVFEVGDQVFLKLQPYRQSSLARRPFEKLASRFYGPFLVLEKVGKVAYKLELPASSRIHPVFHISQLKRFIGTAPVSPNIPDQLSPELELVVEPEEVLAVRQVHQGNSAHMEVLIKWKGLPTFEATWEDITLTSQRFPSFHLEDKVNLAGRGNVTHPGQGTNMKVFTRTRLKGKRDISNAGAIVSLEKGESC